MVWGGGGGFVIGQGKVPLDISQARGRQQELKA
jgi:hypothetical protein